MWFYHITQFSVMRETLACLWPGTPPLRYRLLHEIHRNWETCMQLKEKQESLVWFPFSSKISRFNFPSYQRYLPNSGKRRGRHFLPVCLAAGCCREGSPAIGGYQQELPRGWGAACEPPASFGHTEQGVWHPSTSQLLITPLTSTTTLILLKKSIILLFLLQV